MASREETLLFLVDVQVRGADALRRFNADLDAAATARERRLLALTDTARQLDRAGNGGNGGTVGTPLVAGNGGNGGRTVLVERGNGQSPGPDIVGIRGPHRVGSRENPQVFVQESGQAAGLGGLAAAAGAESADKGPARVQAEAGPDSQGLLAQALLSRLRKPSSPGYGGLSARTPEEAMAARLAPSLAPGYVGRSQYGAAATIRDIATAVRDGTRDAETTLAAGGTSRTTKVVSAGEAAGRLGVPRTAVYDMLATGQLSGQKVGGQWQVPEQAVLDMAAAGAAGGAAGGGGGGGPRVALGAGGGDNSRRGLLSRLLWGRGMLGLAGMGTAASFAGLGPEHVLMTAGGILGSAGTALGGAGMLGLGALGQAAVGGGADAAVIKATVTQVSHLSTAYENLQNAQVAAYSAGVKYQQTVQQFGVHSKQATQALQAYQQATQQAQQAQSQLNGQLAQLSSDYGPKAAKAINGVAQSLQSLGDKWDQSIAPAMIEATKIIHQGIGLASEFAPMIGQAALTNLTIIDQHLKPLFAWLEGPHGIGVFQNLENNFAHNLPYAVDAFNQGIQLLLRVMSLASNYTGGFTQHLDHLLTRLNGLSDERLNQTIGRLVDDFRIWEAFVKALATDLYLLFHQDAATGQSIIVALTGMLQKLGEWERSTQGASQLHNIFEVHKQEILTLLQLLPPLVSGFGRIYLTVAPAATVAFTALATVVVKVLEAINALGPAAQTLVGLALVGAKLGVLGTALRGIGAALGIISVRAPAAAAGLVKVDAAAAAGAAETAGGTAAAEGGLLSRLAPGAMVGSVSANAGAKVGSLAGSSGIAGFSGAELALMTQSVMPGLLAGGAGLFGGSILQSSLGLRGGTGATLGGGAVGGGIGFALGGPLGAALGAGIGSTLGPSVVHLLGSLFGGGPAVDYGKRFANAWIQPFQGIVTKQVGQSMQHVVAQATNGLNKATAQQPTSFTTRGVTYGQPNPQQAAQAQYDFGRTIAQQFLRGISSVPFASTAGLLGAFDQQLRQMPKNAGAAGQAAAAESMLSFAQTLVAKGQLPKSAVATLIKDLERQFPALTQYLNAWGAGTSAQVAAQLKLKDAQKNVSDALGAIRQNFVGASIYIAKDLTAQNLFPNVKSAMAFLKSQISTSTGQAKQEAIAAMNELRQKTASLLDATASKTALQMKQIHSNVKTNSVQAAQDASAAFHKLESDVTNAVAGTAITASKGFQLIAKATNQIIQAFGGTQIPIPDLVHAEQLASTPGVSSTALLNPGSGNVAGHATGGKVTQPMYVAGEEAPHHPEYVLATNPAYRSRNLKLWAQAARDLGVPGFAQGGVVTASEFGGPNDPGTGSTGYRGDNLFMHPDSYAELNMGSALGNLPYLTPLDVTYHGRTARLFKRDIGAGGPGIGGHPRALDLWYQAATALGFSGLDLVNVNGPAGVNVQISGAGAGSTFGQIQAPQVHGKGALASITRGVLAKVAAAANQYVAAHMPSVNTAVGVSTGMPVKHGKFFFPLPPGSWTAGAVDQGWDISAAAHTPEFAIGSGTIIGHGIGGFGQWAPILGLDSGGAVYYGHAGPGNWTPTGTHVKAGQVISEVGAGIVGISTGPHLEIGWYPPGSMGSGASMKSALGYRKGGKVDYAGAFGQGGMVTASTPTMAVFGDNGPETALFMPHRQGAQANLTSSQWAPMGAPLMPAWYKATLANIRELLTGITNAATALQSTGQNQSSLATLLQGIAPGTRLRQLGLGSHAGLNAAGLTKLQASMLVGGGPGSFTVLMHEADAQIKEYSHLQAQLKREYKDALKKHNKKLATAILGELNTVDTAISQAVADRQQALVNQIQALAKVFANRAAGIADRLTSLQGIEALNPGTSLAGLGLSPKILRTLGLSGAQGLVGSGLNYFQNLASQQGGKLTAAQLAQAKAGTAAQNALLAQQETPLEQELAMYERKLPKLHGQARTDAVSTMQGLVQSIVQLQGTIQQNTDGLTQLTTATNQNTNATNAMTGSVAYQYQGQSGYLAGPGQLASDSTIALGVGG